MNETSLEWVSFFAPIATIAASVAVVVVTWSFNRWQRRLAREKLRHQLYERRVAVYRAFMELLLALPIEDIGKIWTLLQKANAARFEVPFLFEDDQELKTYLDTLCERVQNEIISNDAVVQVMRKQPADPEYYQVGQDVLNRVKQLASARFAIPTDHLGRLPREFARFLNLTDFSKR